MLLGWGVAVGIPLAVGAALRRANLVPLAVAAAWAVAGTLLAGYRGAIPYLWCAVLAVGVITWGLRDRRPERINLGIAGFALTILVFYFSDVMDKLGRSASLIGLGLLFLGGGYLLEQTRRRLLVQHARAVRVSPRRAGITLALVQVLLVGTLGIKLLADRARLPHGWARTLPFDPTCRSAGDTSGFVSKCRWPSVPATPGRGSIAGCRLRAAGDTIDGVLDDEAELVGCASTRPRAGWWPAWMSRWPFSSPSTFPIPASGLRARSCGSR